MEQQASVQQLPTKFEQSPEDHVNEELPPLALLRPNLLCSDLLHEGNRDKLCIRLYKACINADWKAAETILNMNPHLIRYSITEDGDTALHVAASPRSTKRVAEFVQNLVNMMEVADLELKNKFSNTALCEAAIAGNLKTVDIMLKKNNALLSIPGRDEMMPLYMASFHGKHDVVKYLFQKSNGLRDDGWDSKNRALLLQKCVEDNMFDIALKIVEEYPELASSDGKILNTLARMPDAFVEKSSNFLRRTVNRVFSFVCPKEGHPKKDTEALELLRNIWKDIAKKPKKEIDAMIRGPADVSKKTYSSRTLFIAAEMGNTKFIVELIRQYPDLIWKQNDNNQTIFHIAVIHRHEGIYNLLYEIGTMKDMITPIRDLNDNTLLHLVGKSAKRTRHHDVSGVAFEMLRELLWFREVESLIPPSYRKRKNKDGLTPHELFTKEHRELVAESEKWMKDSASKCMVVSSYIATIVFAAAFTVPVGYNQTNGILIFNSKATFMVFVVANAISLFSSTASTLMFLSILTSRYAERDFLQSLPKKLMLGLATLSLSITTMAIAFSVSFFVLCYNHLRWAPILITLFGVMPIIPCAPWICRLLADVYCSTYDSTYLFRPKKHVLFYENCKY